MQDNVDLITNEDVSAAIAEPEGMVPQSKVNELIGLAKAKAYEKARAELESKSMQNQNLQMPVGQEAPQSQNMGIGGMPNEAIQAQVQAEVNKMIEAERAKHEEMMRKQEQEKYEDYVKGVALTYVDKMSKGKDLHDDFEAIMGDFEPGENKELVFLASELENPASVLYELNKNQPMKLLELSLAARDKPKLAKRMLEQMQESIKKNQQAIDENVSTRRPLSQLKPSSAAGADSGQMTIQDYKRIYKG